MTINDHLSGDELREAWLARPAGPDLAVSTASGPAPLLVPEALRTPAEGLRAVADRMVWAFGTPLARVPGFRWWRLPSAVVWWAEMRGHQDEFATSANAHLRVTTTTASGKPRTTGQDQLVGTAIALGWVFAVAAILYGAALGLAYAGVPARVVADTTNTIGLVLALSVLGELVFVLAQGWRRTKVLPKGSEDLHRAGHCGLVVIMSNYGARPWKKGHGEAVMRAWLAHADAHNIAVVADARNKKLAGKYIDNYGFQLVEDTRGRLVVRLPALR